MGTQTQDPNRQQQGGTEKKVPPQKPNAHDPKLDPERDDRTQRRTDQNQPRDSSSGSRKPSSTDDVDPDEDDADSIERPGQGGAIDDGKVGTDRGARR